MEFKYELTGAGWAAGTIAQGENEMPFVASYLNDPLGDLFRGFVDFFEHNIIEFSLIMDEEPEGTFWVFQRNENVVHLSIYVSNCIMFDTQPNIPENLQFEVEAPMQEWVETFVKCASELLQKHGLLGYSETWIEHDFPIVPLLKLKHWLTNTPTIYKNSRIYKTNLEEEMQSLLTKNKSR